MASAIPAAIGLGGSIFSGISGKSAARRQERMAREQMQRLQPLLDAQIAGAQFGLREAQPFVSDSRSTLRGAGQALTDLQRFWRPLAMGNRSAIDQFLSPERRSINQGYEATAGQLARFAPRGGGRVTALQGAQRQRQGQLNDLVFGARREGANQLGQLARAFTDLGGQQGGLGVGLLGAGLGGGSQAFNMLGQQQNRAFQASNAASQNWGQIGQQLGGWLTDLFDNNRPGGSSNNSGLTGVTGAWPE